MNNERINTKIEETMIKDEYQGSRRETKLTLYIRERFCVKKADLSCKSGAKVASFNETGNVSGYNLQQFNNLQTQSAGQV
ncbi:hypothetical protein [uncultured Parabacteroides sp.]|uniref:hypothetical protein n=1 Tax=uncultured Parabacteroides sp. TaxID=512312 RepID=UPI0025E03C73|nr:hypothetical protein [uncultured Parabacteroides sp.]